MSYEQPNVARAVKTALLILALLLGLDLSMKALLRVGDAYQIQASHFNVGDKNTP